MKKQNFNLFSTYLKNYIKNTIRAYSNLFLVECCLYQDIDSFKKIHATKSSLQLILKYRDPGWKKMHFEHLTETFMVVLHLHKETFNLLCAYMEFMYAHLLVFT